MQEERKQTDQNPSDPEAGCNTQSSQQPQIKTWQEIFDLLDSAGFPPEFLIDRGQSSHVKH
jgi:hypothetical protein